MILIAHRGNTHGPSKEENHPDLIFNTLVEGYDVEIDVWFLNGEFLLGHDSPQYKVDASFIRSPGLWCHAKNIDALYQLKKLGVEHYFWHQEDDHTLTSCSKIWTYPGRDLCPDSIAVMPETIMTNVTNILDNNIHGVCSDYVGLLK